MIEPTTYQEIKKFAEGLRGCYEAKRTVYENSPEIQASLDWAIALINLHVALKEMELEQYGREIEKEIS